MTMVNSGLKGLVKGKLSDHVAVQIRQTALTETIPKVTIKLINQDRMVFADFSVNSQQIFMKFWSNFRNIQYNFLFLLQLLAC